MATLVAGATDAGAGGDPRARRAALVVQAARLTDRLEVAQAEVVAAELGQAWAEGAVTRTRARLRARAVNAYVQGAAAAATLAAPRAYLEVAAAKERRIVAGFRSAAAAAAAEQRRAEAVREDLRAAARDLAAVQSQLDSVIAAADARRAAEARRADEARRAALAGRAAALAGARGRARAGVVGVPLAGLPLAGLAPAGLAPAGGYAPAPLDPTALLPRHLEATRRQLALMARVPFGPLAAGAPLPAGLGPTGRTVEGDASWYGPGFNGRPTASGAIYDQEAWTVASPDLPLGSFLVVARGDRRVLLLVNDRGPYAGDRVLDLSAAAARALGLAGVGAVVAQVVAGP